ncbi:MAG: hypothetical protein MZV64_29755 [Ignavibacteriales bacterium]|nr:hypothetical protein [Ignavibacteriales bacterium]
MAPSSGGAFGSVDLLNIGLGVTLADKNAGKVGLLVPPFVDPALIHTFLLRQRPLVHRSATESGGSAALALQLSPERWTGPFSTSFVNTIDPRGALRDFALIDSVSGVDLSPTRPAVLPPVAGDTRIPAGFVIVPGQRCPGEHLSAHWHSTPRR